MKEASRTSKAKGGFSDEQTAALAALQKEYAEKSTPTIADFLLINISLMKFVKRLLDSRAGAPTGDPRADLLTALRAAADEQEFQHLILDLNVNFALASGLVTAKDAGDESNRQIETFMKMVLDHAKRFSEVTRLSSPAANNAESTPAGDVVVLH